MGFEPTEAELSEHAFLALSDAAARLWLRAGFWCAASGERMITAVILKSWLSNKKAADELGRAGLWVIIEDRWLIPDREESLSSKRSRAGKQGGQASASKRASKRASKTQARDQANQVANGQAKPQFACEANPGLVPPLASPSPDSDSGSSADFPDSSALKLSSEGSEPSAARATKRRMRRCPDSFALDETGKKLCVELRVNWVVEEPKFRDWEFKDPKSDWQATARTWIRNAASGTRADGALPPRNRPANASEDERARARNNLLDDAKAGRAGPRAKAWAESGQNLGRLADELEAWQRKRESKQLSQQMAPLLEGVGR